MQELGLGVAADLDNRDVGEARVNVLLHRMQMVLHIRATRYRWIRLRRSPWAAD